MPGTGSGVNRWPAPPGRPSARPRRRLLRGAGWTLFLLLLADLGYAFWFRRAYLSPVGITGAEARTGSSWRQSDGKATLALSPGQRLDFLKIDLAAPDTRLWVGEHEVTLGEYATFVEATHYQTVAEREGFSWQVTAGGMRRASGLDWRRLARSRPAETAVSLVAWVDAAAFARWGSAISGRRMRLPRAAEWEALCRAGAYPRSKGELGRYAWFGRDAGPEPVGGKLPDRSGLYDLLGNVWEWSDDAPKWWVVKEKSLRGGGWLNEIGSLGCEFQATEDVRIREPHIGFRVVVEFQ